MSIVNLLEAQMADCAEERLREVVSFSGASDDLVEVGGDIPGCDEYNVNSSADFDVAGLIVRVFYNDSGCWGIAVGQIDETVPVQAEVISLRASGYTMILELSVPPGSHVVKVGQD